MWRERGVSKWPLLLGLHRDHHTCARLSEYLAREPSVWHYRIAETASPVASGGPLSKPLFAGSYPR